MLEIILNVIIGFVLLILGGESLVRGASAIALRFGIPSIVVGLTIVALGTSAPELAVSLKASLSGSPDIAIANIVGSNIFNILFILALCSFVAPLKISSSVIRREVPFLVLISLCFLALLWDQKLSSAEGTFLVLVSVLYTYFLVNGALKEKSLKKDDNTDLISNKTSSIWVASGLLSIGLVAVVFGAKYLVLGASEMARSFGVTEAVIGLTIVSWGTSLPEVIASLMATIRGERDLAVGNVIGSCIYNILVIGGLSGAVSSTPLVVSESIQKFDIPTMLAASILCLPFFITDKTLSRKEGFVFFLIFIGYMSWIIVNYT